MALFLPDADLPQTFLDMFARSGVSLTIGDLDRDDAPLIGMNQAFLDLCGYEAAEVLGRNCRFLQPEMGAGPARERIRAFLADPDSTQARFVLPNLRKDGTRFLNLVYMNRVRHGTKRDLVLASQFSVATASDAMIAQYEEALMRDLRDLQLVSQDSSYVMLGSYSALADSHALIAQARLDE